MAFLQLDSGDISYLLELMQFDTATYCARQRSITEQKLQEILKRPAEKRLAYQDTEYLTELCEDDERPEQEQQRGMTLVKLEEIRTMQETKFAAFKDKESQRSLRSARINGRAVVDNPVLSPEALHKLGLGK